MKKNLILIAFAWSYCLHAQSVDELKYQIDDLSKRKSSLDSEIVAVAEQINAKSKLLVEVQAKGYEKSLRVKSNREVRAIDRKNTATGNILFSIGKNEEFTLLGYADNYFFVDYNKKQGYVYYAFLIGLPGIYDFKAYWDTKILGGDDHPYELPKSDIIRKGMKEGDAILLLGVPEKVKCTSDAFGELEQWVYKDKLLIFENGILTDWKDLN